MGPGLLVLFAPRFLRWPLAALRSLGQELPDLRVQGIVTGGAGTLRGVKESGLVDEVIDVVAQEHKWLAAEGAERDIEQWEEKLQPGALSRILLSDRHLCRWTVGAVIPTTPLSRASRDRRLVNRYLVGLLRAVDDLVKRQGVNAMFAYVVAGAPAMAMAELANMRGLPFFILTNARIDSRHTIAKANYALEGLGNVATLYRAALKDGRCVAGGMDNAREFLEAFRAAPLVPDYQSDQEAQLQAAVSFQAIGSATRRLNREIRRMRSTSEVRNLRKPNPFGEWFFRAASPIRARIAECYLEVPNVEALRGRFAYYPLHVEPEASTMVDAPMFSNQVHVVEAIVKALPPDMTLLVKEHPTMHGFRQLDFYRRLRRLPRVRLISAAVSPFALIRRCDLICSITGTAAFEAMLLRRPALVLGAFPFSVIDKGLITCRDFSRLPEAVGQALRQEPADDHMLLTYLAAVYTNCFRFPNNIYWTKVTSEMVVANSFVYESMAAQLLVGLREAGLVPDTPLQTACSNGDKAEVASASPPSRRARPAWTNAS